ncbi:hypothetical protein CKO38_03275 [Rhodospirillum rubrum]|nr:hypothetical protein [Rhodospirillum rubrum]MBK1675712.1 hypothetical protein [Rhodospirillum rubrum]
MKTVADIHADILKRHAKSPSRFGYFFLQWIKFMDHNDRLYAARGDAGENYLQYRLDLNHVDESAAIFETLLSFWKEREQEDRIFSYLTHEDSDGNGIWHYLADTLREHEGTSTLRMARTLLAMDIDFSKRNRSGQSPLNKMLVPVPRWQSLNALIQTKHLSIENIEAAIAERAKDEDQRNALMSMIFSSDIEQNQAMLSQHVLRQALQPQADVTLRAATCRLFFDYVDTKTGGTAFFKLVTIANHAMFDDLMRLLMRNTSETVVAMGVPDIATRKAYAQAYLARKLLRREHSGGGVLFSALKAGKHTHLRKITSLLRNDDLVIRTTVRGELVRKDLPVDKNSPAPTNPLLSLLLQRDKEGNTVMHRAVLTGDLQALKGFFSGLTPNDTYAIIRLIPNIWGLTLATACRPELVQAALAQAVKSGKLPMDRAKALFSAYPKDTRDIVHFIEETVNEIESLAKAVGRKEPLPPTFRLETLRANK